MIWLEGKLHVDNVGVNAVGHDSRSKRKLSVQLLEVLGPAGPVGQGSAQVASDAQLIYPCSMHVYTVLGSKDTPSGLVYGGQCETEVAAWRSAEWQHSSLRTMMSTRQSQVSASAESGLLNQTAQHKKSAPRPCI